MSPKKIKGVGCQIIQMPKVRKIDIKTYANLGYHSVNPNNSNLLINFLKYKQGDSELVQDIKALVICRIACEALSKKELTVYRTFSGLLKDFPRPQMMEEYMVPKENRSGGAQKYIDSCSPEPGDTPLVLRAKRVALLFYLKEMIESLCWAGGDTVAYTCKKDEFPIWFSWVLDIVRHHLPGMPPELAELVKVHILNPELPFNIYLPDR